MVKNNVAIAENVLELFLITAELLQYINNTANNSAGQPSIVVCICAIAPTTGFFVNFWLQFCKK